VDYHLVLRHPDGTLLASSSGTNETTYVYGFLPDMGGYNWTVTVNYTAGGRNWTNSTGVITFGIDTVLPRNPTHAILGNGTNPSGVWQSNETYVEFYFMGAEDDLSGIVSYESYFGPDPMGTTPLGGSVGNRAFYGTWTGCVAYLRVRAVDNAWNRAELISIYVFMHDALPPLNPTPVDQTNGTTESNVWQSQVDEPRFRWREPYDATSGVDGYLVYLGPEPTGTSEEFVRITTWDPGRVTDGIHYMRIATVDRAGNAAAWSTQYVLRYDGTPPDPVTIAPTDGDLSSTGTVTFTWTVPVDLSGMARYRYRLNNGTGTWVQRPTVKLEGLVDKDHVFGVSPQDAAGNMGEWRFVNLTVDTTPPTGTMTIEGSNITTMTWVSVILTASDATSGVEEMRFSTDGFEWTEWEAYEHYSQVTLSPGDGMKAVYAQLRDVAGHVSVDPIADTVILDTKGPTGTLVINRGIWFSTSTTVTLTITAEDANGIRGMRLAQVEFEWGPWLEPVEMMEYTLSPGDGERTVWVMVSDGAGILGAFNTSILLDTARPTGTVVINGGAAITHSTSIHLDVVAEDATSGVTHIRFVEDGLAWSPWRPFTEEFLLYTLSPGDGERTVYVQLRDHVGLISMGAMNDSIILDTTPPRGTVVIDGGRERTTFDTVALTLTAVDANGVEAMRFSWDGEKWTDWEPFDASKELNLPGGDGKRTVHLELRDFTGTVSTDTITDSVVVETADTWSLVPFIVVAVSIVAITALLLLLRRRGS